MRPLFIVVIGLICSANVFAGDAKVLTGSQVLKQCKSSIGSQYQNQTLKYKRRPAVSYSGGQYTYWINFRDQEQGEKSRAKCIMTKEGELVSLNVESGYWKMAR
ncbi:MAG: hypothetical protein JKY66_09930 [Spongiibacteraceae bacterium]|nr:hypothetical protein [Spongiibacteraceae bacterium]